MERAMSTLDQSKSWLSGFLPIEKPTIDIVVHPPKGVLRKIMHTPNAQSTHNENVVQEIPQAQCAASSMEILQYFSAQRKQLLSSTRVVDPSNATLITFDLDQSTDPFWNWFSDKINMSWKEHFLNHNWWRGLDLSSIPYCMKRIWWPFVLSLHTHCSLTCWMGWKKNHNRCWGSRCACKLQLYIRT